MKTASVYSAGGSACARVGRTTQGAAAFIAGSFLCFGVALSFYIQASLENRLACLFFIGVLPAIISYLSGYVVRLVLEVSCRLCESAVAGCFRLLTPYAIGLARETGARVGAFGCGSARRIGLSLLMIGRCAERYNVWPKALYIYRTIWSVRDAGFEFLCLLIRSTARFLITLQAPFEWTSRNKFAKHAKQFTADPEPRSWARHEPATETRRIL